MPYIQTSRLTLVTFTTELMQAAITDQLELAQITPYKVADGYPSEEYKKSSLIKLSAIVNILGKMNGKELLSIISPRQ